MFLTRKREIGKNAEEGRGELNVKNSQQSAWHNANRGRNGRLGPKLPSCNLPPPNTTPRPPPPRGTARADEVRLCPGVRPRGAGGRHEGSRQDGVEASRCSRPPPRGALQKRARRALLPLPSAGRHLASSACRSGAAGALSPARPPARSLFRDFRAGGAAMAQHGPSVTLSLTLPITCHICLGKVTAPWRPLPGPLRPRAAGVGGGRRPAHACLAVPPCPLRTEGRSRLGVGGIVAEGLLTPCGWGEPRGTPLGAVRAAGPKTPSPLLPLPSHTHTRNSDCGRSAFGVEILRFCLLIAVGGGAA